MPRQAGRYGSRKIGKYLVDTVVPVLGCCALHLEFARYSDGHRTRDGDGQLSPGLSRLCSPIPSYMLSLYVLLAVSFTPSAVCDDDDGGDGGLPHCACESGLDVRT